MKQLYVGSTIWSLENDFDGNVLTLAEIIPDKLAESSDQIDERLDGQQMLEQALGVLDERSARVIRLRFGFVYGRLTQAETAKTLNLTLERLRRIEANALQKMRSELGVSTE